MYIHYQCFLSVNLTLHTVTGIHSKQLKNKMQLETLKQDKNQLKIQEPRERKRNQVSKAKKSLRKRNKKVVSRKKLLMHHLKVILTLLGLWDTGVLHL